MMRVPAAWFDSVTTFTIVTAARGWWDINEGRKGTQELQHWKVEYTTTEGRKSEGFLLFFNFDVTSSTIRKSTNTMIDDTGTKGSNCTRTVVRKPAPTYHFIIPPRTACTITLLEMATSKTHQQMRICTPSQNPTHLHSPAGCLQAKTPSSTHLPAHFATSSLLLQLVFLASTPLEESQKDRFGREK
jgi:hypothetical protein